MESLTALSCQTKHLYHDEEKLSLLPSSFSTSLNFTDTSMQLKVGEASDVCHCATTATATAAAAVIILAMLTHIFIRDLQPSDGGRDF